MRTLNVLLSAAALLACMAPAAAQTAEPRFIRGTITAVNGHLVTVQRSDGNVVVNDQEALNNQMTGNVAVGRQIVARGHWQDGTFYATSFADANVYDAGMVPGEQLMPGRLHGVVRGTITNVNGHLVTISDGTDSIVVNNTPALNQRLTGNVATGRNVVASGYWRGGTFYATTIADANDSNISQSVPDFGAFHRIPDSVSGTITSVSGNQVTLQQSNGTITINSQPALNQKMTGRVAVGRQVVADGYWLHGTFYATSFADATP